eukprot:TRINITY_DN29453_c0_g1_i1.p1 TRINITY_DN29453_c0_g1~~TRINITY_DN29453_c0_g1_i1.p1  ORF type:complete len:468 (-),score=68.00 TRINITY_DN29453_c0_g1_i1:84-1466(-)
MARMQRVVDSLDGESHVFRTKLRKLFDEYDSNHDGHLTADEVLAALRTSGARVTPRQAAKIVAALDLDNSSQIELDELLIHHRAFVRHVFNDLDTNKDGHLTLQELQRGVSRMGKQCTANDIEQMLRDLDANSDGKISWIEFQHIYDKLDLDPLSVLHPTEENLLVRWYDQHHPRQFFCAKSQNISNTVDFLAGTAAGLVQRVCEYPLDTVKVKLQAGQSTSTLACLREIFAKDGVRGYFRGLSAPMAASMLDNAICFGVYSSAKQVLEARRGEEDVLTDSFLAGGIAGAATTTVTCPFEVVKTLMQTQTGTARYNNVFDCTRQLFLRQGIRGFFQGYLAMGPREIIGNGVTYLGYDASCSLFTPIGKTADDLQIWQYAVSGAVGGTAYWAIPYPLDAIKSRMQASRTKLSFVEAYRQLMGEGGVRSLYRGFTMAVVRAVPSSAALFVVYETAKQTLKQL